DRVDLGHDLSLADSVVLLDQITYKTARDHLWGNVHDVGLDERVVGDGVSASVADPARCHRQAGGEDRDHQSECEEASGVKPPTAGGGLRRGGCGSGFGVP